MEKIEDSKSQSYSSNSSFSKSKSNNTSKLENSSKKMKSSSQSIISGKKPATIGRVRNYITPTDHDEISLSDSNGSNSLKDNFKCGYQIEEIDYRHQNPYRSNVKFKDEQVQPR